MNDQLSTILLVAMIAVAALVPDASSWALVLGIGVAMLMKGHAIDVALRDADLAASQRILAGGWVALVLAWLASLAFGGPALIGWVLIVCTAAGLAVSPGVRKAFAGVLGGAYAVYSMTSFLGDVLSYTRLAALGLSGTLVGMVFNILAGLVWGGASALLAEGGTGLVFGALVGILAAAVFVVGHVFNVVINLLGAFVHPARLQFVEFFSKFYEGGGRPHVPFSYKTRSLVLHAVGGQREGGAGS